MDIFLSTEGALLFLFGMAIIAGFVDSIAGGGGLITVPSLLIAGLPPLTVLGTNRMQSAIGELTAFLVFWRNNAINVKGLWYGVIATAVGATLGSFSVSILPNDLLKGLLPVLMIAITTYSIFSNRLRATIRSQAFLSNISFMLGAGVIIGFYNGFFGPGVGSIWMLAFIALLGLTVKEASISTKPLNLIGNIISMFFFMSLSAVNFKVGIFMGAGQVIGSFFGSHVVMSKGDKIVRPVFISVCLIMSFKLIYDNFI